MANGTFEGLIRSLEVDPHRRGKQFEKIVKWWLQNDPIHSRDVKKVWLWDEWPDRPGPDVGIDLVAELKDGSLVAVQAKCFDSERDIPKSELDSFISAASPRKYGRRMLVASTDGLSANARRMLHDNHATQVMFSYLDSLQEFWPSNFLSLGGPRTISKYTPRAHQQNAINDVFAGMQHTSRGQLIMACGTGKTLTALWITERLDSSCTLVLVPSLSLLSQTLSEWATHANSQWSYLCVCSDETVNKSDDLPISNVDELPFEVTTKPADIAKFLKTRGRKIVFSTYQSSAQVSKAQKLAGKKFELTIADEAHRLTGKNDAEFATVLDGKKIPTKKLLFMTATPRTYTTAVKQMASDRGVEMSSMDDQKVFGKELHKLSFGQAIEQDLLTDYRVVIVGVTDPQVQELIERRELVSVGGKVETDARTLAAHIGLAKAVKDYDLKKTISFHGRIKTAQAFAQDFPKIVEWMPEDHKPSGTFWADTITGAMYSSQRRMLLDKLKADIPNQHSLLSNARCLTEGIDVPALDAVAFIDPRSSQVDIIQAVGRAIRKSNNKTLGTIVLPVLIPHDSDAEHALQDTAFKPIWAILNALRSHDENLAIELDNMRLALGQSGRLPLIPRKIIQDLPADIDLLIPDFHAKFSLMLLEKSSESWHWWYGCLLTYIAEHGHTRITFRSKTGGKVPLATWMTQQRVQFREGKLSQNRIDLLAAIHEWNWDPSGADITWDQGYSKLLEYVKEFGTSKAVRSITYRDFPLGSWLKNIRGNSKHMITDKKLLLEALPDWTWNTSVTSWEHGYQHLLQFVETNGTALVPQSLIKDGFALGGWVANQRAGFRSGRISRERIERLETLAGWSWNKLDASFNQNVEALLAFYVRNGHYRIKHKHIENGIKIGIFIRNLRGDYRMNRHRFLPSEIEIIESLPEWSWDPLGEKWEQSINALIKFGELNGNLRPKYEDKINGIKIENFITATRRSYKNGDLSDDQIAKIESIEGWSWGGERHRYFEQGFLAIIQYREEFGNADVPHSYTTTDGLKLGVWVSSQRYQYKIQKLAKWKIERLESLNDWRWRLS